MYVFFRHILELKAISGHTSSLKPKEFSSSISVLVSPINIYYVNESRFSRSRWKQERFPDLKKGLDANSK